MGAQALQLLCLLAAATFAALSAAQPRALVLLAVGAVLGAASSAIVATSLPLIIAVAAGVLLARPQWQLVPPIAAGLAAGAWTAMLATQGVPVIAALVVAVVAVSAAVWLAAHRPGFAPALLRDEALLVVGALAMVLAASDAVAEGWRAALNLAAVPLAGNEPKGGTGLVAVVVASVVLGGGYSLWKRR